MANVALRKLAMHYHHTFASLRYIATNDEPLVVDHALGHWGISINQIYTDLVDDGCVQTPPADIASGS